MTPPDTPALAPDRTVLEELEPWLCRWMVVFANRVANRTLAVRAKRLNETVTDAMAELTAILARAEAKQDDGGRNG